MESPIRGWWLGLNALALFAFLHAKAAEPVVSNVRASQRPGTQLVDIYYDLADSDSAMLRVSAAVSTNAGTSYSVASGSFTGAQGSSVMPGRNKQIIWNAGTDLPSKLFSNVRVSVTASDDTAPPGMALIPAGSFTMGNCMGTNEDMGGELPLHEVFVSAFYMDKNKVSKSMWDEIYSWGINHGYTFGESTGDWIIITNFSRAKALTHPVINVNWYDCVKWCNARSEKEGMTPAYYTSAAKTTVYRSGQLDLDSGSVKWNSGYRLPTEAEWEKAARGGMSGQRFPWGNTISWSHANYHAAPSFVAYDVSPTNGYHPKFNDGVFPYTSPEGYFPQNGYGLHDMAGNVWEWCWDYFKTTFYSEPSAVVSDTRGPTAAHSGRRVWRGGPWGYSAQVHRCSHRSFSGYPASAGTPTDQNGFRCARGL